MFVESQLRESLGWAPLGLCKSVLRMIFLFGWPFLTLSSMASRLLVKAESCPPKPDLKEEDDASWSEMYEGSDLEADIY
jgi:hypothetical protein